MAGKVNLDIQTILDKEFDIDLKGYSASQVDAFLDLVMEDYETYLSGVYGARRQRAVLKAMDRVEKELGDTGTKTLAGFVSCEMTPYSSYNQLDEDYDVSTAAALWILDRLRKHGKLQDDSEVF